MAVDKLDDAVQLLAGAIRLDWETAAELLQLDANASL